jgi:hypothetical protein
MYRHSEARWLDPSMIDLVLEAGAGPIRPITYNEESPAVSFRPVWTLVGVLAIQLALIAFVVWLG